MGATAWPALVLSIALLCAACTASVPQGAPASDSRSADDAAFLSAAEAELDELGELGRRTEWVYETYITPDTEWLRQRTASEATAARVRLAAEAARRLPRATDPTLRRKLELLRTSLVLPAPSRAGAAEELAALTTELSSLYATGRIELAGRETRLDELEVLMRTVRDPARLEEMWTKWHDVARPMAPRYARVVELANEGARELGFADVGELWRSGYEMPPAQLEAEVERLWRQVAPLYDQLHCHVRAGLAAHYGEGVVPPGEPIRADLLGNMWAQVWGGVEPLIEMPGAGAGFDVTELLVARGYDVRRMFEAGERFYISLGLAPLPESFWRRSLLERPPGREVQCHASAWSVDARDDLRVKMCTRVNEQDFRTIHHELGHNYYARAYKDQPFLFRANAHDGFHEAIGDFAALNVTP
jgi:peptidyl-dipeptidase A